MSTSAGFIRIGTVDWNFNINMTKCFLEKIKDRLKM
jgi:hypothetical protein